MKYISIYEKFESELISKTISFLSRKINKFQKDRFIDVLKEKLGYIDFPISELEDSDIQYLNKKNALNIKSNNPTNLDYLKFWFSMEDGYLFTTGTGKSVINNNSNIKTRNIIVDEYLINKLKDVVPTGIVKPVDDYTKLKHLDKVVGIFSDSKKGKFCKATIYIEQEIKFAIQNCSSGGAPRHTDDWHQYGDNSWNIFSSGSIGEDHNYLHYYEESDEPLTIINPEIDYVDLYSFNLFYEDGELNKWKNITNEIKRADFALVISINNLLSKDKSVTNIRKERELEKKDAYALLDNETIKKINIERYTRKIFDQLGIKEDKLELQNLEKIIIKLILNDLAFYKIISNNLSSGHILNIYNKIKSIFYNKNDNEEVRYLIDGIYQIYKKINDDYFIYYKIYIKNINIIKEYALSTNNSYLTEIMEIFDRISIKIAESIRDEKITDMNDLSSYYFKIDSIHNIFTNNIYNQGFRYMFRYINNTYDVTSSLIYITEEICKVELQNIKSLDKFVNKNF
jgi:hypothetical protein